MTRRHSDEKINKSLKRLLKNINNANVKMNEEESKINVAIVEATVNMLISAMKNVNPLFEKLFQTIVYTGSFYDRIRVKEPTEFDLNVVLKLPLTPGDVEITSLSNDPAFVKFKVKRSIKEILFLHPNWTNELYDQKLIDFFDDKTNLLLRSKMHSWIQSVVTKAKNSLYFELPSEVERLDISQSGPAFTYYIELKNNKIINLDLVPVIDCIQYSLPSVIELSPRFRNLGPEAKAWYLVPKPYKGSCGDNENKETLWRISFPEAEKQLLKSEGCIKILIKLLKLLRDRQQWNKICSYHIKTLFLLEMDVNSTKDFWSEGKMGILFMKMLSRLRSVVRNRSLKYYFSPKANLLNELQIPTSVNITSRMDRIINSVNKDPTNVLKYFPPMTL